MRVTGSFATLAPIAPNQMHLDISGQVISYSFNDGINTIASGDPNARVADFVVATDANGAITGFAIYLRQWTTGTSPHIAWNRLNIIDVYTAGDAVENDAPCTLVGTDRSSDDCIAFGPDLSSSNASTLAGGVWASLPGVQTQTAVEYYYPAWNFYFVTAFPNEIAALDGGAFGGVWQRTGQMFGVWSQPIAGSSPTCRFFSTPTAFGGKSSHFYTPFPAECANLQTNATLASVWQLESPTAFYVALTDASGNCAANTLPLFRVYNNGMGAAPNHRYTIDPVARSSMISHGWVAEGSGPNLIFACVPPFALSAIAESRWNNGASSNQLIVLEDGTFYFLYSPPNANTIAGVVQGTLASLDGQFSSSDARDFNITGLGVTNTSLVGTYVPQTSISGAIGEVGANMLFSAAYDSTFEQPTTVAALNGTYSGYAGTSAGTQSAIITIDAGSLAGRAGACQFFGVAYPHGRVDVFDISVGFEGVCARGGSTGIAYLNTTTKTLYLAAPNPARTDTFIFVGTKP